MSEERNNPGVEELSQMIVHRWKSRFIVCLFLLVLSFIGMILTSIKPNWGWVYWRIMAVVFAVVCLWLNYYLKRKAANGPAIWKELLHWLALLLAIYLVAVLENTGIFGSLEAGITVLAMLSLTVFLAGLYIDTAFILLGIVLAVFVVVATLVEAYLTVIIIPVAVIAAVVLFLVVRSSRPKRNQS